MNELTNIKPQWGLLPQDVIALLRQREWQNKRTLKARLKGEKPFPIVVSLKSPKGNIVLENMKHFQDFVTSWQSLCSHCEVMWEDRPFRSLSTQKIPVKLIIPDMIALAHLLGPSYEQEFIDWQAKIDFITQALAMPNSAHGVLIDFIDTLSRYHQLDLELLVALMPQLKKDMGNHNYLRTLPITHVDTKFIETNFALIEALVDARENGTVKPMGLLAWLACREKPKDWLLIRPLCPKTQSALGGVPLLRLATETLLSNELPAENIIVSENEQSCLALPAVPNTIAVSGGGKNITWMQASWLANKRIAYWGDIDSEGLAILSLIRGKLDHVCALMMDEATVLTFQDRMVGEPNSVFQEPSALLPEERMLFRSLRAGNYANTRLEQERIPLDYVTKVISQWFNNSAASALPNNAL